MEHLLDFFDRYIRGSSPALLFDDGFRHWSYTYDELRGAAEAWAGRLRTAGLNAGDRLLIWCESRFEWVAAFWGSQLQGVTVIPVEATASPELVSRIAKLAAPRGILLGQGRQIDPALSSAVVFHDRDVQWTGPEAPIPTRPHVNPEALAEIVFTSGTTGDPKGVLITHRNVLANIRPIEREALALRRYLWPFRPIRFLGLLPLSHMFGQALSIFFPPLVNAATVFTNSYNPDHVISQVRRHRVTLMVTVPRMLDMLRDRIRQRVPRCANPDAAPHALISRLWRYRDVHRLFGWRFCGFVLGGAPLDPALEQFWGRIGYAVVQGYGLTETAPIVAWNHPFRPRHGTVGRPLEGIDVRIAEDDEILVRGPAVTTGYLNAPDATRTALEGGWFHTGDLGALDESGHLTIRGRKKDVIVRPDGMKVFPEDVERILEATPGVREAAVVGQTSARGESVHAVLVLHPKADADAIVRAANAILEAHQHVQSFSVWTDGGLPRTEPMHKLKRFEIRRWVEAGSAHPPGPPRAVDDIERLLQTYAKDRTVTSRTTLDELGLTSLDRIELMMKLEDRAGVALSEAAVSDASTAADLRRLTAQPPSLVKREEPVAFPAWSRSPLVRSLRNISQPTWILPLANVFFHLQVQGVDRLQSLTGPAVFASNHQSHFDTPVILRALPERFRRTLAVSMGVNFFEPYFFPALHSRWERLTTGGLYVLAACFFNGFPLPQTEAGAREALRYMGELASNGDSILIFPEGHRTEHGEIRPFQPGVAMIASKLGLPVVPVRLEGVHRILHKTWRWPRRGDVRVTFGAPLYLDGTDYAALSRRVEEAVVGRQASPR